jgi:hypothetical protein
MLDVEIMAVKLEVLISEHWNELSARFQAVADPGG